MHLWQIDPSSSQLLNFSHFKFFFGIQLLNIDCTDRKLNFLILRPTGEMEG